MRHPGTLVCGRGGSRNARANQRFHKYLGAAGPAAGDCQEAVARRHSGLRGAPRPGLIIANVTGYLASLSSSIYAVTYALHDFAGLWPLGRGQPVVRHLHGNGSSVPPLRTGCSRSVAVGRDFLHHVLFSCLSRTRLRHSAELHRHRRRRMAILGVERLAIAIPIVLAALILSSRGLVPVPA